MVRHIVFWKLKDQAEGGSRGENAVKMKQMLESLKAKISQIWHLEVGINMLKGEQSWDVALTAEFMSFEDMEIYLEHPEHKLVAEFVGKVRSDRAVVDYES